MQQRQVLQSAVLVFCASLRISAYLAGFFLPIASHITIERLHTMATQFSQMSQSERSRYRLQNSNRRVQKSIMAGMTIQRGSQLYKVNQDGVSFTPYGNGAANPDGSVTAELATAVVQSDGFEAQPEVLSSVLSAEEQKALNEKHNQRFTIEKQVGTAWISVLGCADYPYYADRARDLEALAGQCARAELGTKFRIKRVSGDRAVIRIAARKVKGSDSVELYSWKS